MQVFLYKLNKKQQKKNAIFQLHSYLFSICIYYSGKQRFTKLTNMSINDSSLRKPLNEQ